MLVRVMENGHILIPLELGRKYGITPGVMIQISEIENGLLLKPIKKESVEAMRGILKGSGVLEALLDEREEERKREG